MQSKHDAATNFVDAGNAFKKADPQGNNPPPHPPIPESFSLLVKSVLRAAGFPPVDPEQEIMWWNTVLP